jgi:hypothetical protein
VLDNDYLRGRLSFSISCLSTKMDYIDLDFNDLVGEIPPQIGNLISVTLHTLRSIFFTGVMPSSLDMLHKLERLHTLRSIFFTGVIPSSLDMLHKLERLFMGSNNFQGTSQQKSGNSKA